MNIIDTDSKLEESLHILDSSDIIACDTETAELDFRKGALEGIGYGTDKHLFFIPFPSSIPHGVLKEFFTKLFTKMVIFHNAKYDLQVLVWNKFPIPDVKHMQDTMIMSWLVDENTGHGLKQLARDLLQKEPKHWKELNREVDMFRTKEDVMLELAEYCCEDVENTFLLYGVLKPLLAKEKLDLAYNRVELRFIPVLCAMEMRGIKVDVSLLEELHRKAQIELKRLEAAIVAKIQEKAPKGFGAINIRSPKQLNTILFDIFRYKVVKETDSGAKSTDAESLRQIIKKEKLAEDDFLPMLLKFRDLDKVDGTYFVALAQQAGLTSIIHCNFLQHGTRSGRISSTDPNLQNLPSRNDEWNVRQAFIPREGYKFVIADYSQLELRMMAHLSQDEVMLKTFNNNGDIHGETMKAIGANRHHAKIVNFSIIYGIGPRSLAQELDTKEEEAKLYMARFFDKYAQVKYFIDKTQALTLKSGFVEMLTGRRRHFREVADKRWWNDIARKAVNTKIQGSAADLVKVAMINMHKKLKAVDAHILVQIHDEVIVEVPEAKVEEAKAIVKDSMENTLKFSVPMIANIVEGERWIKG